MKRYLFSVLMLALFSSAALYAASKPQPTKNQSQPATTQTKNESQQTTAQNSSSVKDGGEVFNANCSRCHVPPGSISQRTTGTIIMHMRARAKLSREDELLLLKYMAP